MLQSLHTHTSHPCTDEYVAFLMHAAVQQSEETGLECSADRAVSRMCAKHDLIMLKRPASIDILLGSHV